MLEYEKRLWLARRSAKLLKRRTKRIKIRKTINQRNMTQRLNSFQYLNPKMSDVVVFVTPKYFSIEHNRKETLEFFAKIIDYLDINKENVENKKLYINSEGVELVSESALLYLFAIVSDAKSAKFTIGGNHPKKLHVRDIYKACGFNKLMTTELFDHPYTQGNIFVARSYNVPTAIASDACNFIVEDSNLNIKDLYPAFIEMMTNATQHAYDEDTKLDKKWQIFIQRNIGSIRVIFLDTGKGIPETVKKTKFEKIRELFSVLVNVNETMILKSAFDGEFRSSTGKINRGNGLPQIYKVMSKEYVKSAVVYTGRVSCTVINGSEPEYFENKEDLLGTLYELNISRRIYEKD